MFQQGLTDTLSATEIRQSIDQTQERTKRSTAGSSAHGFSCSRRLSPLSGRNSTYRPVQISGTGSEIILTRSLKQFRLDKIEVCCGLQKLVRAMMLQGCRTAERAEVVESGRFATPNSLKSHGERNLLSPFSNTCAITPKLCMPSRPIHPPKNYPALKSTYRG